MVSGVGASLSVQEVVKGAGQPAVWQISTMATHIDATTLVELAWEHQNTLPTGHFTLSLALPDGTSATTDPIYPGTVAEARDEVLGAVWTHATYVSG